LVTAQAGRPAKLGMMKSHWVLLQHVDWEGPGIIGREAEKRGFEIDVRRMAAKMTSPMLIS